MQVRDIYDAVEALQDAIYYIDQDESERARELVKSVIEFLKKDDE